MNSNSVSLTDWQQHGIVYPLTALSQDEARDAVPQFQSLQHRLADRVDAPQYPKVNVASQFACDLVCNTHILDAVECLIGPDILCWSATFFAKPAKHPSFVGWHQDCTYWGLSPVDDVVTVWLGLTDSQIDNGCMQSIHGTHTLGQLDHQQHTDTPNLLQSGQEVSMTVTQEMITDIELAPGQFSIHHSRLLHGSAPNHSDRDRIGLSINYIAAHVQQTSGTDSAMLVRGKSPGHFLPEPKPAGECTEQTLTAWLKALRSPSGLGRSAKHKETKV